MFSSRGLFKNVPCPGRHDCTLPNCFFSHDSSSSSYAASNATQVYDPTLDVSLETTPPPKRRKVQPAEGDETHDGSDAQLSGLDTSHTHESFEVSVLTERPPPQSQNLKRTHDESSVNDHPVPRTLMVNSHADSSEHVETTTARRPASMIRTVSPPPVRRTAKITPAPTEQPAKRVESQQLVPRKLENAVPLPKRDQILKKFHKQLVEKNEATQRALHGHPELQLDKQEVIRLSLDLEERAARENTNFDAYKNAIADRLTFFRKMSTPEWKIFVMDTFRAPSVLEDDSLDVKNGVNQSAKIVTGLNSTEKETSILKLLRTSLLQYAQYGYVVKNPPDKEVANAKTFLSGKDDWEECDRCGSRFAVFRGRNEAGKLTSNGSCRYHWARSPHARNGQLGKYECCHQDAKSPGCTTHEHHVFKVTHPARLAAILPFKETPKHDDGKKRKPVVYDCEMGYTTHGMELIRLTALRWPTHETLVDVLVRPIGEVLDLNTRFSGVSSELYSIAPAWNGSKHLPGEPLQKVASPAAARDLLFDHLDPDTPLLGHAIENDLNAARIIHPFVIDTVLLYPHPRGLPIRYKLRDLAQRNLQRTIQTAEAEGHDSKEDSEATGDLVLVKVRDKWRELQRSGWWWKDDTLMPPKGKAAALLTSGSHL